MLEKTLGAAGFLSLVLGAAAMDSDMIFTPAAMVLIGLMCMAWSAKESRAKKKTSYEKTKRDTMWQKEDGR